MNNVNLMGRLTKEPELRKTKSDKSVVSFSLAVDRPRRKDKETEADFFDIVAWGSLAEFVSKYISKGQRIVVTGRLQTRTWVDKEQVKRKYVEVIADQVYFADSKKSA